MVFDDDDELEDVKELDEEELVEEELEVITELRDEELMVEDILEDVVRVEDVLDVD